MMRMTPTANIPLVALRQLDRVARVSKHGRARGETVDDYLARLATLYAGQDADFDLVKREFNAKRYGETIRRQTDEDVAAVVKAFHAVGARMGRRQ